MKRNIFFSLLFILSIGFLVTNCKKEEDEKLSAQELELLEFSDEEFDMYELDEINLLKYLTIMPEEIGDTATIQWKSFDTDVAIVSDRGRVTAVQKGVTSIQAMVMGKKALCEVNVKSIPIKTLSMSSSMKVKVNELDTLQITVTPGKANPSNIKWSTSSENLKVSVDLKGTVTVLATEPGTYTITAEFGDIKKTCSVTATYTAMETLTMQETAIGLAIGDTHELKAVFTPETATYQTLKWSSSKTSVVTVDANGKITAVAVGTAVVTVKSDSHDNLSATCTVTVTKTPPVTDFSLSTSSIDLYAGESETISVTSLTPGNADASTIVWSSSNTSVATVSNGKVVASSSSTGTAVITASVNGISKTCTVNVKKVSVESITFSSDTIYMGAGVCPFTASVYPSNATFSEITYTSTDADEVYVADGKVYASTSANGRYTITVTADGVSRKLPVYVLVTGDDLVIGSKCKSPMYGTFGMNVSIWDELWNATKYGYPEREIVNMVTVGDAVEYKDGKFWYTRTDRIGSSDVSKTATGHVRFSIKYKTTNGYWYFTTFYLTFNNSFLGVSHSCRTDASSCAQKEGTTFTAIKTASGTYAHVWYFTDSEGDSKYYCEYINFSSGVPTSATTYNLCVEAANVLGVEPRTIKIKAGSSSN